jgi:hypothetical protein
MPSDFSKEPIEQEEQLLIALSLFFCKCAVNTVTTARKCKRQVATALIRGTALTWRSPYTKFRRVPLCRCAHHKAQCLILALRPLMYTKPCSQRSECC